MLIIEGYHSRVVANTLFHVYLKLCLPQLLFDLFKDIDRKKFPVYLNEFKNLSLRVFTSHELINLVKIETKLYIFNDKCLAMRIA